jgi:Ca2+/H+ antiporter
MSPDIWFILALAIKMVVAAGFVVAASFVAERAGALVGALVLTLPIGAGPAYILLALDHGAAFIADSTVASLAVHAASGIFGMAYVVAAQRRSFAVTMAVAVGTWIACALAIRAITWSVPSASQRRRLWRLRGAGAALPACADAHDRQALGSTSRSAPRWWRCWSAPWSCSATMPARCWPASSRCSRS